MPASSLHWAGRPLTRDAQTPQYPRGTCTAAEPAVPDMQEGLFTLRATAPSWIEVRDVQGTVTVSRIFVIGETWQGETAAGYSVSVRDAGAVQLYDGPKLIGALGARGAPIANLTLSRDLSSAERPEIENTEIKTAEFQ